MARESERERIGKKSGKKASKPHLKSNSMGENQKKNCTHEIEIQRFAMNGPKHRSSFMDEEKYFGLRLNTDHTKTLYFRRNPASDFKTCKVNMIKTFDHIFIEGYSLSRLHFTTDTLCVFNKLVNLKEEEKMKKQQKN